MAHWVRQTLWLTFPWLLTAGWKADSSLVSAARDGRTAQALEALQQGADPNAADPQKTTALIWAASRGGAQLIDALLRSGASPNAANDRGLTALWAAAENNQATALQMLVARGARLDADSTMLLTGLTRKGNTEAATALAHLRETGLSLLAAIRARDKARVRQILADDPFAIRVASDKQTPLMAAVASGDPALVEILLTAGSSVNEQAANGETPLTVAMQGMNGAVISALLAAKPEPRSAMTALMGVQPGSPIVMQLSPLARLGDAQVAAARDGDWQRVRTWIPRTGSVDWKDSQGVTALQAAVERGNLTLVQELVYRGAGLRDSPNVSGRGAVAAWLNPVIEAANGRGDLSTLWPLIETYEELWRLSPHARAILSAMDREARQLRTPAATGLLAVLTAFRSQAEQRWDKTKPVPLAYRASLLASLWTLRHSPSDADLESISGDLEEKLAHCRATGTGLGGRVQLEVRTMKGGMEVRNWRVFYLPKLLESRTDGEPFPSYSSPTSENLPPGRYVVWAANPDTNLKGQRSIVRLGQGKTQESLQIPVP